MGERVRERKGEEGLAGGTRLTGAGRLLLRLGFSVWVAHSNSNSESPRARNETMIMHLQAVLD